MSKQAIYVDLDYAPKTNGKKFKEWCGKYGFDALGSGRRAWCSELRTYFRDALGVAISSGGEMFLFYEEDLEHTGALLPPDHPRNKGGHDAR